MQLARLTHRDRWGYVDERRFSCARPTPAPCGRAVDEPVACRRTHDEVQGVWPRARAVVSLVPGRVPHRAYRRVEQRMVGRLVRAHVERVCVALPVVVVGEDVATGAFFWPSRVRVLFGRGFAVNVVLATRAYVDDGDLAVEAPDLGCAPFVGRAGRWTASASFGCVAT